jgi:hypothetical protein
MAFIGRGSLLPYGAPVLLSKVISNSLELSEGDSVKLTSGFVAANTAAALTYGHVNSFVDSKSLGLLTNGTTGAALGSFYGTYTTASNNQTVGFVKALIDVSKHTLYSVDMSAALGTTAGSNIEGNKFDITNKATLNEASVAATTKQYNSFGVDVEDSANLVVNVYQSAVFGV